MKYEAGKTKDTGYQFGKRKTFPVRAEEVWERLFCEAGMRIWLGEGVASPLKEDEFYLTNEGISGKVRLIRLHSHIRMSWKKADWPNESTLQIRVIPNGWRTIISFHQEKLLDQQQREEMEGFWEEKFESLTAYLSI